MPTAPTIVAVFLSEADIVLSRSDLRWDYLNVAAATAFLSIALAAIALFFFRRRARDLTLIYFGLLCILYGVRLLTTLASFQALFDRPGIFWTYLTWLITCIIILPLSLFLYQLADEYLRKPIRWILALQAAFATFGILGAAGGLSLPKLYLANNAMILLTLVAVAILLAVIKWRPGASEVLAPEFRVFIAGFLFWMVFVLQANLAGIRKLPSHNVEFVGFLGFVVCLGYVSAYRTFANEERLLAIKDRKSVV